MIKKSQYRFSITATLGYPNIVVNNVIFKCQSACSHKF